MKKMRALFSVVVTLAWIPFVQPAFINPPFPNMNPLPADVGGTGLNATTPYTVFCGGVNSTTPLQQVAGTGSAGQVLTSNDAGQLPSWQNSPGIRTINQLYPDSNYDFEIVAGNGIAISAITGNNYITITASVTGFSKINIQTFLTTGSYYPTAGMQYAIVEVVGGGGGGGGVLIGPTEGSGAGGGGGAGGYVKGIISASTLATTLQNPCNVTVGLGGTGGAAGSAGSTGGISSFGNFFAANGGLGGGNVTFQTAQFVGSGYGGWGGQPQTANTTTGAVLGRGASGSAGFAAYGGALSGMGAPGYFGGGNAPGAAINTYNCSDGYQGQLYGSGGAGGIVISDGNYTKCYSAKGGAAAPGIVIITEFM